MRDGKPKRVELRAESGRLEQITGERIDARLTGVALQNFRSENDPSTGAGVLVTDIDPNSTALGRGLRPGDIIVAVNRQPVQESGGDEG